MKQIWKFGILIFVGFIALISSCTKDTFTEEDAFAKQQDLELLKDSLATRQEIVRDSLQKLGGIINYSVGTVLASDAAWYKPGTKGNMSLDGVIVTVAQHGKLLCDTTDASGIASFKDLRIGTVNVNVRKTGYTEVDFVASLPALLDTTYVQAYNLVRHAGTMVALFSTTTNLSTITGIATVETDLTNEAPEAAANIKIMGVIDVDNSYFQKYIYDPYYGDIERGYECDCEWWSFDYYGKVKEIAYHSAISTATTGTDGSFTLQVPSTPDGLPIELVPSEFAANQSILQATVNGTAVFGVQSLRTLFGPSTDYTYSTLIPALGVGATQVQSAYVQFSAPTGTPAAPPTTQATATAILASSGIASVNITSPGSGYTQAPRVVFSHGTGWNSVLAEGTAVVTNGGVTAVNITSAGSGYKPTDTPTVTFTEDVDVQATATPIFSYSLIGFSAPGVNSGYTSTAPTVTISGDGTGATAHAVMAGNITKINVTNPGGYTTAPKVVISDSKGNTDLGALADMSDFAPLASLTYVKPATVAPANLYDGPPAAAPAVVISGGGGTGATATCTLATVGQITSFNINTPGTGYVAASTVVTITGGGSGSQWATATATVDGAGAITAITLNEGGFNYTSVPTVTISGVGTGATATAVVRFPIASINLTSGGANYSVASEPAITVGGNGVPAADIYAKFIMIVEAVTFTVATTYETQPAITFTSVDGFAGTTAAATPELVWKVGALVVDNEGSGYTFIPNVIVGPPQPGGTTATATATLGNGVLKEVIVDQPGMGYTAAPHAEITDAGTPVNVTQEAQLAASVSNGQVTSITVSDAGAGYTYKTTYAVRISTYNLGAGAAATAHPNPKSGQIEFIQVDNPGAGYVVTPVVEIVNPTGASDANGFGTGAAATAVVTDGRVSAINVTNGGSGYYAVPTVTITVPISSMKAVAKCNVDGEGKITGVDFTGGYPFTKGYGYNAVPTVTFFPSVTGKGSGATGVAILKDGRVDNVVMTNQGSGYVGRNYPTSTMNMTITPSVNPIIATAGKAYLRDIYYGTGKRIIEQ